MSYRAALIGCGRIGSTFGNAREAMGIYSHAEAYRACPDTSLAAICDTDESALSECGIRWGVAGRYRTVEALLAAQSPEVLSICTPDATHYDITMQAVTSPATRAVLVEKPLATGLAEARALVAAARERGVLLAVNYSRRYAPSHVLLRKQLRSGALGTIKSIGGFYTKGTLHNGTHWFDLVRFLVGEVVAVLGIDSLHEAGADPTLDAVLELANGAVAHLQGFDAAACTVFEMDILGTAGRVRILDGGQVFENYRVADNPHFVGYRQYVRTEGPEGGLRDVTFHAIEDLVRCLQDRGQPRCSGEDAITALEIAAAVRESSFHNRRLPLPYADSVAAR